LDSFGIPLALGNVTSEEQRVLRISADNSNGNELRFQLEGKLVGPWIEELRRVTEQALADGRTVSLDLERVRFIDFQGVVLLRTLIAKKVRPLNCSPFISQQLQETTL